MLSWPEHGKTFENRVFWWPEQIKHFEIPMFVAKTWENYESRVLWWPEQIEKLKIPKFWWPEHAKPMKNALSCGQNM